MPAAKPAAPQTDAQKAAAAAKPFKAQIVWHNIVLFIILHSTALYGLYLIPAESAYLEILPSE